MAKKSDETIAADDFTERIYKEVEKNYGQDVMIDGVSAVNEAPQVIPWTPSFDLITSGGIAEGTWVGITGREKLGKTVACLTFAANAQKPEYGARPIYYFKVEGRLSLVHLQGIKGLDLSRGKFNIIQSVPGDEKTGRPARILTGEEVLNIALSVIKTVPRAVLIIDSMSSLCPEEKQNNDMTENGGIANSARMVNKFLDMAAPYVPVNRTIVLGITRLISNIKPGGPQYSEKVGSGWRYQADYQLRALMKTNWKVGENNIGLIVKWVCNTSALGKPGLETDAYLRFGVGFDRVYELLQFGMTAGLVKVAGSWMSLDFLNKPAYRELLTDGKIPKFQGGEKLYDAITARPDWMNALRTEVSTIAGGLAKGEE